MKTFQDEQDDYEQLKHKVMSEEQCKLANQIRIWFSDAYSDKSSRNVFDEIKKADEYWEGDAHKPESDTDPNSNTNVVNSTIEGQVAYLIEQNIAIEAKPRGPSDLPFRDKAVTLMTFCKEQNRIRRVLEVHERRRKKYGVGILRVLFDPDALDGMGLPVIEPVNPEHVYPDPIVHDIYKINEGRFIIETFTRSIESARAKYGDEVANCIVPGYIPNEVTNEDEVSYGEVGGEFYIHMLVWTHGFIDKENEEGEKEKKKILRLIEMSACGMILRDTAEDKIEICEDDIRFPYFFTPDMYREGTIWAKSTASLVIPVQDTIDDIENQIILNARLTGNPQRLVSNDSDIDVDKLTNEPGLAIPTNNINGMKNLEAGQMPQYIIQHRDKKLLQELPIISRWSHQMNGVKQTGVNTATEALGLQQAGTQNITHDKILLEETLSELFTYCLTLMLENYTDEEVFSITEKTDDFQLINPSEMRNVPVLVPASEEWKRQFGAENPQAKYIPDFMPHKENLKKRIALDVSVTVGAGLPSNKAFVFQMLERLNGMIPPHAFLKLVKEYVGLPIDESLTEPPEPQPMTPQQPMQDPMIQGLTQGANPMMPQGGMM